MKSKLLLSLALLIIACSPAFAATIEVEWISDGTGDPPMCYWSDPDLGLLQHVASGCNVVGRTPSGDRILICHCRVPNMPLCSDKNCITCVRNADNVEYCADDACDANPANVNCPDCRTNDDCPRSEQCVRFHCQPPIPNGDGCEHDDECKEGSMCSSFHNFTCQPRCMRDEQCGEREICVQQGIHAEDSVCRPGTCRTHSDCGAGEICYLNFCGRFTPKPCTRHKDCGEGGTCADLGAWGKYCMY